jgi:hypothetical protein
MPWALLDLSAADETTIVVAAVTAFVTMLITIPLRLFLDGRLNRNRERTKWEFEHRRELRKKIGQYHGRLLEAATSFNYRLVNLDEKWPKGWHSVSGKFAAPSQVQEYLRTLVYRFLVLQGLVTRFQREVMFIDSRIGKRDDQVFLFYLKALQWTMTDEKLFAGLDYDSSSEEAHFFTDHLRRMSDAIWVNGEPLEWAQFEALLQEQKDWTTVLEFFDGIEPGDLRWDRLRAYRLVLMGFINTFGYKMQRSPRDWIRAVAGGIQHPEVAANLYRWIPKFDLGHQRWGWVIRRALKQRAKQSPSSKAQLRAPIGGQPGPTASPNAR